MKTACTVHFAWLVVCAPLLAADGPSLAASLGGLSDTELARVRAECEQRCDALFRKQAGHPRVRALIQTDWNDRGDFTREYNQSILLFGTRAFHLQE